MRKKILFFRFYKLVFITVIDRICQELGLNREETLSSPILKKDGSVDAAAMALRRRIFYSCYCLDKYVVYFNF